MRPNPLMATLIFFAWVTCFEPTVPCKISSEDCRSRAHIPLLSRGLHTTSSLHNDICKPLNRKIIPSELIKVADARKVWIGMDLSGTHCGGLSSDVGGEALVLVVSEAKSAGSLESRELVQGSLLAGTQALAHQQPNKR